MSKTLESFIQQCAEDCANANQCAACASDNLGYNTVGAWVKMPGLDPAETNALNYLTIEQLDTLKARVEKAIETATRKAQKLSSLQPGDPVRLTRRYMSVPPGATGILNNRACISGEQFEPDDFVNVAFQHEGTKWVPVAYVVLG